MSNYTKTTNFATKDALPSGNPAKIVKGTEIDTEFNNIATAVATKSNSASPTFTGTLTAPVVTASTSLNIAGDGATVTGIKDEDDMASNSATKLATQQSIKAYVDSQVTAQDLDVTDGTTSISIDLDSEALSLLGGTGIDSTASGNGVTMAIDSTVATLTGTQTLSNKTLTSPDVNTPDIDGGTIDGTVIGGTTAAAGSFTTVGATGNITVGGTVDGRDVAADGTKLDGIEAGATADQTAAEIKTAYESNANTNAFTDADESKLDGIEALADVTDTANVTAAGALMDSELTNITAVKALDQGVATTDSPSFAGLTASGEITANGGIALGDNDKATFGASDDLQIYHDGSSSYVEDAGSGNLILKSNGANIQFRDTSDNIIFKAAPNATTLYYAASQKLATTSTGIDVTGTATMDGLTVDGSLGSFAVQSSGAEVHFSRNNNNDILANGGTSASFTIGANNNLTFKTGATLTQRLQIASNGNLSLYEDTGTTPKFFWDASAESLGIGTSSPSTKLHVLGGRSTFYSGDNYAIGVGNASGVLGGYMGSPAVNVLSFSEPGGVERMRIDVGGNVGIGVSSPSAKLHLGTTGSGEIGIGLQNSQRYYGIQTTGGALTVKDVSAGGTERMRIDSSGNLLVGTTDSDPWTNNAGTSADTGIALREDGILGVSAYKSTTNVGNVSIFNRTNSNGGMIAFNRDGSAVGSISVTTSATAYNTSSDQRLKENIVDANDAGDKIDAIQVRQYDWKVDGSHQDYGMVAQELQAVAPEAVSGDADSEEMMGVDYSKLVPMLIKEIQSLRNRVAQLEG
jgi:hypothetical protein